MFARLINISMLNILFAVHSLYIDGDCLNIELVLQDLKWIQFSLVLNSNEKDIHVFIGDASSCRIDLFIVT